jgi:hypothetical protein
MIICARKYTFEFEFAIVNNVTVRLTQISPKCCENCDYEYC